MHRHLNNTNHSWGWYMQGHVYYDKKSKRWYIQIYLQGKQYAFYCEPIEGKKFYPKEDTEYPLNNFRSEIENKSFNTNHWKSAVLFLSGFMQKIGLSVLTYHPIYQRCYKEDVVNWIMSGLGDKDNRLLRYNYLMLFMKSIDRSDKRKCNIMATLKTMLLYAWKKGDFKKRPVIFCLALR